MATQEAASQAYATAEHVAKAVSHEAARAYRNPDRFLQSYQDEASRYVRANPTQSVLIATGLGFVLGALHRAGR